MSIDLFRMVGDTEPLSFQFVAFAWGWSFDENQHLLHLFLENLLQIYVAAHELDMSLAAWNMQ